MATRIGALLAFWRWLIPRQVCPPAGRLWPWTLGAAAVLFLAALEIAIFSYVPGGSGQTKILHICWKIQAVALALPMVSISSGFACKIEAASWGEESRLHRYEQCDPGDGNDCGFDAALDVEAKIATYPDKTSEQDANEKSLLFNFARRA